MSAAQRSRNNIFSGLTLDRCSERRSDAAWLGEAQAASNARFIVLTADGKALVETQQAALRFLTQDARQRLGANLSASFLGVDDLAHPYFALIADTDQAAHLATACDAAYIDLRRAGQSLPSFESGLFAYARGLSHWQSRTRWCGVCGNVLSLEWGGHRARCTNAACAAEHYPRTDPAIIVIVTWRDACLLGRQASWPQGRYSTLAGFVEPGETLEDAVCREVFEEAGVRVVDSDYHSSQPWPFPASLMLGFTARAEDPTINVGDELADARWFEVDDFLHSLSTRELLLPPPLSVSYRLIEHWLKQAGGLELSAYADHSGWR